VDLAGLVAVLTLRCLIFPKNYTVLLAIYIWND
jgi:hypothetical protein